MNILVLGKFPPLQGGGSAMTWRAASSAAAAGNQVRIVTNAVRAAPTNKVLVGQTPQLPSNVSIQNIDPIGVRAFIPWGAPDVSQLVGRSLLSLKDWHCDMVVGWYLEPYGVVAAYVAAETSLPLTLIHAGSDIGRLARHAELAETYRHVIKRADHVLVGGPVAREKLAQLGLQAEQVVTCRAMPVPVPPRQDGVGPKGASAGPVLRRLLQGTISCPVWIERNYASCGVKLRQHLLALRPSDALFDEQTPVVAIFGKIHPAKGFEQLFAAASRIAREKPGSFRLLFNVSGDEDRVEALLAQLRTRFPALAARTLPCPILHPSLMPELLSACSVVCILDQGFTITPHRPRVLREALAAGAALIVSAESAGKSAPAGSLQDGGNAMIVKDPDDTDELCSALSALLDDRNLRRRVQIAGKALSQVIEASTDPSGPLLALIKARQSMQQEVPAT